MKLPVKPDAVTASEISTGPAANTIRSPNLRPMGAATSATHEIARGIGRIHRAPINETPSEIGPHRRQQEFIGETRKTQRDGGAHRKTEDHPKGRRAVVKRLTGNRQVIAISRSRKFSWRDYQLVIVTRTGLFTRRVSSCIREVLQRQQGSKLRKLGIDEFGPIMHPGLKSIAAQHRASVSHVGEKLHDAFVCGFRRFEMNEMAGPLGNLELWIRKVFGKSVHPCGGNYWVMASPVETARHLDFRQHGRTVAYERHGGGMSRSIPGEATFEITGLQEVVDEVLDLAIEGARRIRPVREHTLKIKTARFAAVAHEIGRPGLLVEGLVPDLFDVFWVHPAGGRCRDKDH